MWIDQKIKNFIISNSHNCPEQTTWVLLEEKNVRNTHSYVKWTFVKTFLSQITIRPSCSQVRNCNLYFCHSVSPKGLLTQPIIFEDYFILLLKHSWIRKTLNSRLQNLDFYIPSTTPTQQIPNFREDAEMLTLSNCSNRTQWRSAMAEHLAIAIARSHKITKTWVFILLLFHIFQINISATLLMAKSGFEWHLAVFSSRESHISHIF